jgi:hypothetical protein
MGQAIDYALGQWPSLLVFLEDGRLEIDNNLIESASSPGVCAPRSISTQSSATPRGSSVNSSDLLTPRRRPPF